MGPRSFAARALVFVSAVLVAGACAGNREGVTAALGRSLGADLATPAFTQQLCGAHADANCRGRANDVWADVRAFYEHRGGEAVWVNGKAPTSAAAVGLGALNRARDHGLDPERYAARRLSAEQQALAQKPGRGEDAAGRLAAFESDLTTALLALGRDVAIGLPGPPPAGVGGRHRNPPDITAHFSSIVDEGDFTSWPDDVRPAHPQYAALQQALENLNDTGGSASDQARVLALNLERWRWMPETFGPRHVLVNIPAFHMYVFENGHAALDSRVIVGRHGDETPIFSATMTSVVFSPYWNIPESIAEGETLPSIVRNPEYLAKNNIEVLRRSGGSVERVDPSSIDWNNASETSDISLRQRPGPGNALGHVKFLLPNKNNVYLHDTPTHNLFSKNGRAFSHGCVRLEQPVALAQYVLADQPKWTEEAIRRAMNSGDEQSVKLNQPLPVHIVYFTAWAGADGQVEFLKDVYGQDSK